MFGNRMLLFLLVPGGFTDLMNKNDQNSNWKKKYCTGLTPF